MTSMTLRATLAVAALLLTACEGGRFGTENNQGVTDGGFDGGQLADGIANIWVDPDGCQHWYIDDGLEGYMTPRINPQSLHPVCGTAEDRSETAIAKDGSTIVIAPEPQL